MPLPKTKVFRRFPDPCIRPEDNLSFQWKLINAHLTRNRKASMQFPLLVSVLQSWGKGNLIHRHRQATQKMVARFSSFLTSSTMSSTSDTSSSSIEETLKIPLVDPTVKKRKVARECRKINLELNGVLEKYHKSLSCVLGIGFLYSTDEEREEISETAPKINDLTN